jgi:transposase
MTFFGWKKRCRQLEAEKVKLQERNTWLEARVAELAAKNTQLVQALAAATKNSRNSSKRPSSDIVKPPAQQPGKGKRRKIGGQRGHPKHERAAFSADQIDQQIVHQLRRCPVDPSHTLVEVPGQAKTLQQVELVEKPFVVTEHVAKAYWCASCQQVHYAALPAAVVCGGLCGPRLTSLVSYFKGKMHASYSGMADFFADVLGLKVSRGYLAKLIQKAAQAFARPCSELMDLLPKETRLNIDETGHKENGHRYWTWCFRAKAYVVFKIDRSRGSDVLMDVLGQNFQGLLGADFWGAYRKYARQCGILIQFCLAHLIREVKYLCEFPEPSVQRYGQALLEEIKGLFCALHRRAELSQNAFEKALLVAEAKIWDASVEPLLHPRRSHGKVHRLIENLAYRFYHHGEGYFRFITSPGIEPTNNSAEQAMRFVVMDRHITQGTRSRRGRDFCERIWTVIATCALQKRSAYHWMHRAICAHFNGQPVPSLLLDSS